MSQESWVSLAALGAFAIALFGYLRNISKDLKTAIGSLDDNVDKTRAELVGVISGTRAELVGALTGGFAKVEARLIALEQRTYDISTRLPASPASTATP